MRVLSFWTGVGALLSCTRSAQAAGQWFSDLKPCPQPCALVGEPSNWTVYHEANRLDRCAETMLVEFNLYNKIDRGNPYLSLSACTVDTTTGLRARIGARDVETIAILAIGNEAPESKDALLSAGAVVQRQVGSAIDGSTTNMISVGYKQKSVIAFYAGSKIQTSSRVDFLQTLIDRVQAGSVADTMIMQVCGQDRNAEYIMGAIAQTSDHSLGVVQNILKSWNEGKCFSNLDNAVSTDLGEITLSQLPDTTLAPTVSSRLRPRANCKTVTVVSGDGCASLATKCGISSTDLSKYNPASDFCSTLQPGQHVCCSSGTLPKPVANSDGTCATYTVLPGDWCAKIAASNNIQVSDIENFNKNTWGWKGCDGNNLLPDMTICLSTGDPPMPPPVSNTVCGPQVPDTKRPSNWSTIADLNPCPLNVCCSMWGFCGINSEFCNVNKSGTGAPGTSGCISNCGSAIILSDAPPAQFIKLAYFEAFNPTRSCLDMAADQINTDAFTGYTHVHFAFGGITNDFQLKISSRSAAGRHRFIKPAGIYNLIEGKWGVTAQDLVASAVRGYKGNGNKNGWGLPDSSTAAGVNTLFEDGIRAPGLVQIPVCSSTAAFIHRLDANGEVQLRKAVDVAV